ncbi:hypothetical protein [Puniceibacterium sediminis]|uniref:D-galactarate dehydratase n=1 Tax=Puniceibacterium sediminis TaxID=1608407 RepID=A0A238XPV7_9RHOB|nr:hypothetical protein [Puniceibacterium sediminis]SNR60374.1 hypothetical protein SAMN06265370_11258 [Puniceibacterium sediminis]
MNIKWILLITLPPLIAGCTDGLSWKSKAVTPPVEQAAQEIAVQRPVLRSAPEGARTAAQFDVTTPQERAAAASVQPAGERSLGTTVASLGDPTRVGFWLETPLISEPGKGRVVFPGTGKSANVDLIPIDGPATAGSRLSLSAMRLIGAPLTDLPTIKVYAGG